MGVVRDRVNPGNRLLTFLPADLTPQAGRELIDGTVDRFGRLDALVLDAGITRAGPVAELLARDWAATVHTNLTRPAGRSNYPVP